MKNLNKIISTDDRPLTPEILTENGWEKIGTISNTCFHKCFEPIEIKLRAYLKKEFERNNHQKYRKWFDLWFVNLTENQIAYYTAYMNGNKTPYI